MTVVNTATSFIAETTTSTDGAYYVPYLTPGDYRVKVNAPGFKEFVREGITLRSAEVPRVDILLALGSVNDSVTVVGSASLLNTENVLSAYVIPSDVLVETPGVMKRTVYLLQYMPGVVGVVDGHNLPWKNPNLAAPNTTYNLNNTAAWARFTGVVGDFSNFGTAQANVQVSVRAEF